MSQAIDGGSNPLPFTIPPEWTGQTFVANASILLLALASSNSGATEPPITYPGMLWQDISGSPAVLKMRNQADDGWIVVTQDVLGVGQSWQVLTGSRSVNTSYQNTTGRTIAVAVRANVAASAVTLQVSDDNSTWVSVAWVATGDSPSTGFVVVPPGHYYRVSGSVSIGGWQELR